MSKLFYYALKFNDYIHIYTYKMGKEISDMWFFVYEGMIDVKSLGFNILLNDYERLTMFTMLLH